MGLRALPRVPDLIWNSFVCSGLTGSGDLDRLWDGLDSLDSPGVAWIHSFESGLFNGLRDIAPSRELFPPSPDPSTSAMCKKLQKRTPTPKGLPVLIGFT